MLSFDSKRWMELRTAYGNGGEVVQWLARLTARPEGAREHWEGDEFDYWGYLCHQETVYTASYAAVPHLVRLVDELPQSDRHSIGIDILSFIAAIAGCACRDGIWRSNYVPQQFQADPIPDDLRSEFQRALAEAESLIVESIGQARDQDRLTELLTALSAVRGYPELWQYLSMINDDRECPKCGEWIPFK